MSYKDILKMIEEVDPSDRAKLDEIDARVWCWISGLQYASHERRQANPEKRGGRKYKLAVQIFSTKKGRLVWNSVPEYTRSRDKLKQIRPNGWRFCTGEIYIEQRRYFSEAFPRSERGRIVFCDLANSEELAELHVIIQSIANEREENED